MAGYGICGHTNEYNTKVLCGGWVEATIGMELEKTRVPATMAGVVSEAGEQFEDPAAKEQPAEVPAAAKVSMRGLDQNILLHHCQKGEIYVVKKDPKQFRTTHGTSFSSSAPGAAKPSPTAMALRRRKEAERERRTSPYKTMYAVEAAAPFRPQASTKVGAPSESAERRTMNMKFTRGFIQAHNFGRACR